MSLSHSRVSWKQLWREGEREGGRKGGREEGREERRSKVGVGRGTLMSSNATECL